MPAANYILERVQVQFGWLKSGWDQVWEGSKPRKSSVVASVRVFCLVTVCACFMPYTAVNREYSSRSDTCMVCMYESVDVLTQVRILVE